MTEKLVFVVLTNAKDGQDDEFNTWYTERHLPDVLKVPGIVAAQRFKLSTVQRFPAPHPYKYLALYEVETDDPHGVVDSIKARSGTTAMPMSDAFADERLGLLFEPITARVEA